MKKIMAFAVVAIGFVSVSFMPAAKSVKLQYTFNVGDQFEWTQNTKQKITQSIMGNSQEIETGLISITNLSVVELTATGAKVAMEYSKLSSTMKAPMGEIIMDSEAENPSNESKFIKSMMGKKFYFYISKSGTVEKVEGTENLWSGISSLKLEESSIAVTKQLMERYFGDEALKSSIESAFVHYPDMKVKEGDTWKHTIKMSMGYPMQVDNTWQLKELSSTAASLSMQSVVATADKESITNLPNEIKAKFDLNGTQNATGNTTLKNGWLSDLKTTTSLKGKMILMAGGPIPSDMEIPMEIASESSYKIIKK